MPAHRERFEALQQQADQAVEALNLLDTAAWVDAETPQQFESILAYVQLVLHASNADLVGPELITQLAEVLQEWINNPGAIATTPDPWRDRMLDRIARLPVTRGHDIEQEVKTAAATFQRSARQRLASLDGEARSIRQEIATARSEFDAMNTEIKAASAQRLDELAGSIDETRAAFEQRLRGYESNLETEREEGIRLRGDQATAFQEAQTQRAAKASEQLEESQKALELLKAHSRRSIETFVEEIQRMKDDSEKLVGVIGTVGTAERYGQDAKEQKKIADIWRWITVGLGLSAIAGVIAAILEKHPAAETYGGKIALSLILGGVAGYAANQSKSHRDREKHSRNLQLELTAFSPFIEPLTVEQKEEERVRMARKTFGRAPAVDDGDELGPTPLSLLMQRRVGTETTENTS